MKKLMLALVSIALMATAAMADATEVKMKIKAKEKDGIVKAKVSMSHDMLTTIKQRKKVLRLTLLHTLLQQLVIK